MSVGIPMEMISMLGSGVLSGAMTIWAKSLEAKHQHMQDLVTAGKVDEASRENARKFKGKGVQFTRRLIAIAATFAIVVWPKIVPVFWPDIPVTVGWTEWNPGFLFFEGSEATVWHAVKGLALTPLDTNIMASIIGLYFGASIVKNAR